MAFVHRYAGKRASRVDGLTEAKKALADVSPAFTAVAVGTIDEGTDIMLSEARKNVPFRRGTLLLSHGKNVSDEGLQAAVGVGDPKAKWVHFGTRRSRAQPWLFQAYRVGAKYIRREMRKWGKEAGERIKTRTKKSRAARAFAKAGSG